MPQSGDSLRWLAAQIVIAHISHNETSTGALTELIRSVYQALANVAASDAAPPTQSSARLTPSRKTAAGQTVFDSHLICMECGLHMKMLKRHLQTAYGLSPEQYRTKWGLDSNYPMVAPEYAKKRSSLAKAIGLGTRPREGKTA